MAYSRHNLQASWASLLRRARTAPPSRYPEAHAGMRTGQVLRFLQALDLRLEELENDLRESETLREQDRAREIRIEREAVSGLKATFLEVLRSTTDGA